MKLCKNFTFITCKFHNRCVLKNLIKHFQSFCLILFLFLLLLQSFKINDDKSAFKDVHNSALFLTKKNFFLFLSIVSFFDSFVVVKCGSFFHILFFSPYPPLASEDGGISRLWKVASQLTYHST